jgi:hypothetical protein
MRTPFKLMFLTVLLAFDPGCTIYRHADYTLIFTDARTGLPAAQRSLKIVFLHEFFPLNAPGTIQTNLDSHGMVSLRLADHVPTWVFLTGPEPEPLCVIDLNLHAIVRDSEEIFTVNEKHGGECRLVLTKSKTSLEEP